MMRRFFLYIYLLFSLVGLLFLSGIEATSYSLLQGDELLVSGDSYTNPSLVGLRAVTNKVGIGITNPTAKLSVTLTGADFIFAAMSSVFKTNLGSLGSASGSEVVLGSFGFLSGNQSALGIRGIRSSAGSDYSSGAIGLGMDVDNTVRAGASLYLSPNGNVGIGTSTPTSKLQVVGTMKSSQWNVTEVMYNVSASGAGAASISTSSTANFTTSGGTLEVFVTGSGYYTSAATLSATVYITDTSGNNLYTVGTLYSDCNETNSHKLYIPHSFVVTGVAAGTYKIKVTSSSTTYENQDDLFACTVTEWPF